MGRGGPYLGEGGGFMRSPFGNISAPKLGYLWDYARRANVSVRSYGEFVQHTKLPNGDVVAVETVPGLKGVVAPSYAGWDLDITDAKRVDNWLQEFRQYEANGNLPQLSIIRLPNDHTAGTRVGSPTPRAMIADNDVALGRVVEAISGQRLLEGLGDLRRRRRCAERTRSCGFTPIGAARREPVREARVRGSHVLHDVGRAADDRAHPGAPADEPVRRGRDARCSTRFRARPTSSPSAGSSRAWRSTKRTWPRRSAQPCRSRWISRSRTARPKCCSTTLSGAPSTARIRRCRRRDAPYSCDHRRLGTMTTNTNHN